jgi:hypothetical protein
MRIRTPDALLYAVVVVAMAGTAGLLGYRVGRDTADADGAYVRGVTAGERGAAAEAEAGARAEVSGPARRRVFAAGMERGRREGFARGRRAGLRTGRSEGFDRGADSAFRAFPDWRPGAWYVVRIADGRGRSRFTIPERVVVDPRRAYRLCGATICQSPTRSERVGLTTG